MSPVDVGIVAVLVLGARLGYARGLGEALWPALRWILIALLGAAACGPAGRWLMGWARIAPLPAAVVSYTVIAAAIGLFVEYVRRRVGDHLAAVAPWGKADAALGGAAGALGWAAALMIAMAYLHPLPSGTVDWSPAEVSTDEAVGALVRAVMGTVRKLVLEDTFTGHLVRTRFGGLLIPSGDG